MIKARIGWCTCRVENILTLGKLLSLWFCSSSIDSILFSISQTSYRTYKIILSYELARPVMGTIFLVTMFIILQNIYRLCKSHTTCSALEFLSFTYIFLVVIIYLLSLLLLTDCCSGRVFLSHYGASARPGHRHLQLLHRKLHGRRPAMQSKTLTLNTTPTSIGHTL